MQHGSGSGFVPKQLSKCHRQKHSCLAQLLMHLAVGSTWQGRFLFPLACMLLPHTAVRSSMSSSSAVGMTRMPSILGAWPPNVNILPFKYLRSSGEAAPRREYWPKKMSSMWKNCMQGRCALRCSKMHICLAVVQVLPCSLKYGRNAGSKGGPVTCLSLRVVVVLDMLRCDTFAEPLVTVSHFC